MSSAHIIDISAYSVGIVIRELCCKFVSFYCCHIGSAQSRIKQECLLCKCRFILIARKHRSRCHKVCILAVYSCDLKCIRRYNSGFINDKHGQAVELFGNGKIFYDSPL